jgi:hypothetical protein
MSLASALLILDRDQGGRARCLRRFQIWDLTPRGVDRAVEAEIVGELPADVELVEVVAMDHGRRCLAFVGDTLDVLAGKYA